MSGSVAPPSPVPNLPDSVVIREVGPRDGLQGERVLGPEQRIELVIRLIMAGCRRVEAASFVSERAVPAMAGARDVIAGLPRGHDVRVTALVADIRGAEAALQAGVDELSVTVAASPVYNERNVRRTIDESVEEIGRISRRATQLLLPVDAIVSCAFGSPYETTIPSRDVARLCRQLLDGGASAITLADTTGVANPGVIAEVLGTVTDEVPLSSLGLHLHETRGTALVNAYASLALGVTRFDTSIGGLGGSPFAEGAGGNLATEDFVSFLDSLGVATGIDLDALLDVVPLAERLVGRPLPSHVRAKK
ncbi:MAG: hydroxymethylglutaryl-CoA lyase [Acidimicrobiales bacterium]